MPVVNSDLTEGFSEKASTRSWDQTAQLLEEEAGFVAMADNGTIKQGDYKVVDNDPGIPGVYLDPDLFNEDEVRKESRNSGGFFFRNGNGNPVELKYRFDEELREYPELVHMHNVPELYVADGRFEMNVASEIQNDKPKEFERVVIEDDTFVVPSGLYHGIVSRSPGSNLVVARGDPRLERKYVGKWDVDGDQMYDHFDGTLEKPELSTYDPQQDEMYRMW